MTTDLLAVELKRLAEANLVIYPVSIGTGYARNPWVFSCQHRYAQSRCPKFLAFVFGQVMRPQHDSLSAQGPLQMLNAMTMGACECDEIRPIIAIFPKTASVIIGAVYVLKWLTSVNVKEMHKLMKLYE